LFVSYSLYSNSLDLVWLEFFVLEFFGLGLARILCTRILWTWLDSNSLYSNQVASVDDLMDTVRNIVPQLSGFDQTFRHCGYRWE